MEQLLNEVVSHNLRIISRFGTISKSKLLNQSKSQISSLQTVPSQPPRRPAMQPLNCPSRFTPHRQPRHPRHSPPPTRPLRLPYDQETIISLTTSPNRLYPCALPSLPYASHRTPSSKVRSSPQ